MGWKAGLSSGRGARLPRAAYIGHTASMRIVEFQNYNKAPLVLLVEPWGQRHEVPHLATAGIRYAVPEGTEDRCYSLVSGQEIRVWCNANSYEIDIVCPLPCERLMWDICVRGGWCGGIVDGEATTVYDLLPASGTVTARLFAELTVRADGWPASEPLREEHLRALEELFIEHLGQPSVDVEELQRVPRRPFEVEAS